MRRLCRAGCLRTDATELVTCGLCVAVQIVWAVSYVWAVCGSADRMGQGLQTRRNIQKGMIPAGQTEQFATDRTSRTVTAVCRRSVHKLLPSCFLYKYINITIFIHSVVCLTTGPEPLHSAVCLRTGP